jgi:hypothetical protein
MRLTDDERNSLENWLNGNPEMSIAEHPSFHVLAQSMERSKLRFMLLRDRQSRFLDEIGSGEWPDASLSDLLKVFAVCGDEVGAFSEFRRTFAGPGPFSFLDKLLIWKIFHLNPEGEATFWDEFSRAERLLQGITRSDIIWAMSKLSLNDVVQCYLVQSSAHSPCVIEELLLWARTRIDSRLNDEIIARGWSVYEDACSTYPRAEHLAPLVDFITTANLNGTLRRNMVTAYCFSARESYGGRARLLNPGHLLRIGRIEDKEWRAVFIEACSDLRIDPNWAVKRICRVYDRSEQFRGNLAYLRNANFGDEMPFQTIPKFLELMKRRFFWFALLVIPLAWYFGAAPAIMAKELDVEC